MLLLLLLLLLLMMMMMDLIKTTWNYDSYEKPVLAYAAVQSCCFWHKQPDVSYP